MTPENAEKAARLAQVVMAFEAARDALRKIQKPCGYRGAAPTVPANVIENFHRAWLAIKSGLTDAEEAYRQASITAKLGPEWDPPRFVHDCKRCIYLGRYCGVLGGLPDREQDLYACPSKRDRVDRYSLLARYGNEAHEYASTLETLAHLSTVHPGLAEAHKRAEARGIGDKR